MKVGRESATTWVCRATWTRPSCSDPPRAWSVGRDACSGSRPVAPATSSTSATAYSRPVRSKTSRRSSRRFAKECPPLPDANTGVLCMAYGSPAGTAENDGIEPLVGLPLAPHYAEMSLGAYFASLRQSWDGELIVMRGFHDHPAFIAAVRNLLAEALVDFEPERIFFTAHSLPARIEAAGDPYRERLLESCRLVAEGSALPEWEFAFQSASHTGEPWLGPDLLDSLARSGVRRALVCPIGFVADHLEILYDIDVEAMAFAREHGIDLRRTQSFNTRPEFIDALAAVVGDALVTASPAQSAGIMTE